MSSVGIHQGRSNAARPALADLTAGASRLLTPKEEAELVEALCQRRTKIQNLIAPLLKKAPDNLRLQHFDQQMAYYHSLKRVRANIRTRVAKLSAEYNQIKHELVLANLPWVTKLSHSQRSTVISEEDMFQEGICGLLKAIDRFEAKRGLRLMTYATWYIREAMQQVRARQSHTISLSAHDQTLLGEIENRKMEFQHEYQRLPSPAELGTRVCRKANFLRKLQAATSPAVSLERNSTEGTIPVVVEDPAIQFEHEEAVANAVSQLLDALPTRERLVVTRRFGLEGDAPASLETLGGLLKVSKERVRQLQRQALRRMQESAGTLNLDLASV